MSHNEISPAPIADSSEAGRGDWPFTDKASLARWLNEHFYVAEGAPDKWDELPDWHRIAFDQASACLWHTIAALSAPVGEPVPRGGAVADWWAESIKLYRQNKLLRKALLEQHDWHLAQGEKDFGEGITLNMADEYSDSGMCERTTAALDAVLPSGIEGYEKWKAQNTHPPAPAVGPDAREALGESSQTLEYLRREARTWGKIFSVNVDHVLDKNRKALSALTRPLGGFVQGSIADGRQCNEQQRLALSRASEMLHIASTMILEHCSEETYFYDGADCDGVCIAEDCRSARAELLAVAETDADAQREDGLVSGGGA